MNSQLGSLHLVFNVDFSFIVFRTPNMNTGLFSQKTRSSYQVMLIINSDGLIHYFALSRSVKKLNAL